MIATLTIILLCGIVLLLVPVELIVSVRRDQAVSTVLRLVWLFGLVRFTVPVKKDKATSRTSTGAGKSMPAPKAKAKAKAKAKRGGVRTAMKIICDPRLKNRVYRFVKDLFKALHVSRLSLTLRLGLDDPAETGRLWALMGPLAAWLRGLQKANIDIAPNFGGEALNLDGHGQMKIIPLQVIYLVVAFLLSPIMIRSYWLLRQ